VLIDIYHSFVNFLYQIVFEHSLTLLLLWIWLFTIYNDWAFPVTAVRIRNCVLCTNCVQYLVLCTEHMTLYHICALADCFSNRQKKHSLKRHQFPVLLWSDCRWWLSVASYRAMLHHSLLAVTVGFPELGWVTRTSRVFRILLRWITIGMGRRDSCWPCYLWWWYSHLLPERPTTSAPRRADPGVIAVRL